MLFRSEYAGLGLIPAGSHANRLFCEKHLTIDPQVDAVSLDLISDAQTSGGLFVAIAPADTQILLNRLHDR